MFFLLLALLSIVSAQQTVFVNIINESNWTWTWSAGLGESSANTYCSPLGAFTTCGYAVSLTDGYRIENVDYWYGNYEPRCSSDKPPATCNVDTDLAVAVDLKNLTVPGGATSIDNPCTKIGLWRVTEFGTVTVRIDSVIPKIKHSS